MLFATRSWEFPWEDIPTRHGRNDDRKGKGCSEPGGQGKQGRGNHSAEAPGAGVGVVDSKGASRAVRQEGERKGCRGICAAVKTGHFCSE